MAKVEYGIQMYSLYDVTKDDLKGSLKHVADLGYKYIEFAGYFGHSAEEIKSWLDEFGLVCSGAHIGTAAIEDDKIEETIAFHKTLGCMNPILPGADYTTEEAMEKTLALINRAVKTLAKHGMTLGYHNHSNEFMVTPFGKVFEEELIARTDAELEVDTFWVYNAGMDPIPFLEKHKDRIRVIHLKDGLPSPAENKKWIQVHEGVDRRAIGEGTAPVVAVREWAMKNNKLMVIESEGITPSGPEEVARCIKYLRSLEN